MLSQKKTMIEILVSTNDGHSFTTVKIQDEFTVINLVNAIKKSFGEKISNVSTPSDNHPIDADMALYYKHKGIRTNIISDADIDTKKRLYFVEIKQGDNSIDSENSTSTFC
jgi:hypothetical protein